MIKNNQNKLLTKIGNWISLRLDKYESIIIILFVIGVIFKISSVVGGSIIVIIALMTLSTLYFFSAFSLSNDENAGVSERFVYKLTLISTSIVVAGICYRLEHWPLSNIMLICGCVSLLLLLPTMLIMKSKKTNLKIFKERLLIRVVLIASIGFFLYFAPMNTLVKVGLDKETTIEKNEQIVIEYI